MLPFTRKPTDPFEAYYFKNSFSEEEFLKLETQLNSLEYSEGTVANTETEMITSPNRRSQLKWIPHAEEWLWMYRKIHDMILEASNAIWDFDLHAMVEEAQYTEYRGDQEGHYNWHVDLGPGMPASTRKVSLTLQLSDPNDYEGGDLEFFYSEGKTRKAPREKGLCVLFPSYVVHRVTPVTRGIRKSLVLWAGGIPFK